MKTRDGILNLKLDSREALVVHKALAAEQRVKMLSLLAKRAMNINEIALALDISQPTASIHVRVLEDAGLVETELVPTDRGSEKRCRTAFRRLVFESDDVSDISREIALEIPMPIGLFTAVSVAPPCGMADEKELIGYNDNPETFLRADRARAQLIWFSAGWVEYTFASNLPPNAEVGAVEFVAELCSETTGYNNEWPSDITVWINGIEVGSWMSPGDLGGTRGRLNPDWWPDGHTQFGMVKSWIVDESGSKVDGVPVSNTRLSDLGIGYQAPVVVRVGNRPDAAHIGGLNLFGRQFGNYAQDLILRIRYKLRAAIRMAAGS
jgi:predicted transcriptional regulator